MSTTRTPTVKIHIVEITDPRPASVTDPCRVTYAQFEDAASAQAFAWWSLREKYSARYFTDNGFMGLTHLERQMLDRVMDEYNLSRVKGDTGDAL